MVSPCKPPNPRKVPKPRPDGVSTAACHSNELFSRLSRMPTPCRSASTTGKDDSATALGSKSGTSDVWPGQHAANVADIIDEEPNSEQVHLGGIIGPTFVSVDGRSER